MEIGSCHTASSGEVYGTNREQAVASHWTTTNLEDLILIAIMLSQRLSLSHRPVLQQHSAVAMPFADSSFDFVWTEHAQMNIADKARF